MALIKDKGAKDDAAVSMDFGQGQAALATGKYEVVTPEGVEAGPEIHSGSWEADAKPANKPKAEASKGK